MTLLQAVRSYQRIAIAGGPRTGKTTLARRAQQINTSALVVEGDSLMHLPWSEASQALALTVNNSPMPVIVEGVQVPRALRKGMLVDAVIWLPHPRVPLTSGQAAMTKGCQTVFDEWRAQNPTVPVIWGVEEEAA